MSLVFELLYTYIATADAHAAGLPRYKIEPRTSNARTKVERASQLEMELLLFMVSWSQLR